MLQEEGIERTSKQKEKNFLWWTMDIVKSFINTNKVCKSIDRSKTSEKG